MGIAVKGNNVPNRRAACRELGMSIIELLVSLALTLMVLGSVVNAITDISKRSRDDEVISRAHEVARAILDYMVFDIRLLGAGMPLGQDLFPMATFSPPAIVTVPPPISWGDATYPLGDGPWPILPNTDATHIYIRLNERGVETVLSSEFDPGASNTFGVLDLNDFLAGDVIYIFDRRKNGNAGLRGQIVSRFPALNNPAGRTPGTITINGNRNVSSSGATPLVFGAGSSVNRVSTVSYVSPPDGSGIQLAISDYDATLRTLYPNTSFSITYIDRVGVPMALPNNITNTAGVNTMLMTVIPNLASLIIQVSARGDVTLSDGTNYVATASQEVAIRNLLLSYY